MTGGEWPEAPSPRFIFHRLMRQRDLCPTPPECPQVLMEDPQAGPDALPCDGCPAEELQAYLASPGGKLISVVIEMDFMLQVGIQIPWSQVTYAELLLLRQLAEERDAYQLEQMKRRDGYGR